MSKIKILSNLGILIFSFLIISCGDKLNLVYRPIETSKATEQESAKVQVSDAVSSEQKSMVEQKTKAEQGDVKAQHWLGDMYYYGKGVSKDLEEALRWYEKAAENEHAQAQYWLGRMYYYGKGVPEDHEKASYWWKKAAENGHVGAQSRLGDIKSG